MQHRAKAANYVALHALAARLEREREIVLPELPADGTTTQIFETSGAYFDYLCTSRGMSDAKIRDHWQGMGNDQREQLCPSDWEPLQTNVQTTQSRRPSKAALTRIVKQRRRRWSASKLLKRNTTDE